MVRSSRALRESNVIVEENKLTVTRESPVMCAATLVAKQINLPLTIVCNIVPCQYSRALPKQSMSTLDIRTFNE